MKLLDIKNHNEKVEKSESINTAFFKHLYYHCIKTLDMVPIEFIKDMYHIHMVYFESNENDTIVSFEFNINNWEEDYSHQYTVSDNGFNSHNFDVFFEPDESDFVFFDIDLELALNCDFTIDKANEIFGKFLVDYNDIYKLVQIKVSKEFFN